MGIKLGDNINITAGLPNDCRYQNAAVGPYTGVSEANTIITSDIRYTGLTVNILGTEYWYKNGVTDIDLVEKTSAGGGTITGGTNGLGVSGTNICLGGTLITNTTILGGSNDITFSGNSNFYVVDTPNIYMCGTTTKLIGVSQNDIGIAPEGGDESTIIFTDQCISITDTYNSEGLTYVADYSTIGSLNPRWIPDVAWVTGNTGGGDVYKVGTPAICQVAVWTGDGTVCGGSSLRMSSSLLCVTGSVIASSNINANGSVNVGNEVNINSTRCLVLDADEDSFSKLIVDTSGSICGWGSCTFILGSAGGAFVFVESETNQLIDICANNISGNTLVGSASINSPVFYGTTIGTNYISCYDSTNCIYNFAQGTFRSCWDGSGFQTQIFGNSTQVGGSFIGDCVCGSLCVKSPTICATTGIISKTGTDTAALCVVNSNGYGTSFLDGAIIAEFIGDSDSIQIINEGQGDYFIGNPQQYNGIEIKDGTGGVRLLYNGSTVLSVDSSGGIDVTGNVYATCFVGSGAGLTGTAASLTAIPASHTHGSINNGGCLGTVTGCIACTTTAGCLSTMSQSNMSVGTATTSGTVTTAAQPAITSVGTLAGLTFTGDLTSTGTGTIATGVGQGSVALTINDSCGNANVTFNHIDGIAGLAGNVGRITVNTDSTTAPNMSFALAPNATTGAVAIVKYMRLVETGLDVTGNVTGTCFCATSAFRASTTGYKFCAPVGCGCAVDWVATSDCRLKKCIEPITSALSKVNALCGVCYELCEDGTADMGLIAQDVEKIEPRLVSKGEPAKIHKEKYGIEDETLGLKYDKFAGLFVEAIKELKLQNSNQQLQINDLKSEIKILKNK